MFKRILVAFLVLVASVAPLVSAHADGVKRVVPTDYATIADALFAAGNGDVILIKKGMYHESLSLPGKDNITIRGKGKVIIDGGGATCLLASGEGLKLKNLIFQNGGDALVVIAGSDGQVEKCQFRDNAGHGLALVTGGGHEVLDSKFKNIVGRGLTMITHSSTASRLSFRNTGQGMGLAAITVVGDFLTVEECEISGGLTQSGIVVGSEGVDPGSEILIADNEIKGLDNDGVLVVNGSNVTLIGNVARKVTTDAFELAAAANNVYAANNRAQGALDAGFEIYSDANVIMDNKSKKCGNGFRLLSASDGSFLKGNRAKKNGFRGFWLEGDFNTLVDNLALGSGVFDLIDDGVNNSFEGNVFGSVE